MQQKDRKKSGVQILSERILALDGGGTPQVACHDFLRHVGEGLEGGEAFVLAPVDGGVPSLRCLCRWGSRESDLSGTPLAQLVSRVLDGSERVFHEAVHPAGGTAPVTVLATRIGSDREPGVLAVLSRPGAPLVQDARSDLAGVAGVAGLHLKALTLAARLERQEVLGRCARKLSSRIASGVSDLELLDFFTRFIGETFLADMASIYSRSEDGQWIHLQSLHDARPGVLHGGREKSLCLGDLSEPLSRLTPGQDIEVPDVDLAPVPDDWKKLATEVRIGALFVVPLPSSAGEPGLVVLGRERTGQVLSSGDAELFHALVQQAAPLLENTRMVRELRHNLDGLARLLDTSREVSSQLDLSQVPRLLARRAMEMTAADEGMVMLLEPDGRTLKPVLALSEYAAEMMKIRCTIGEGIAGHVARTRVGETVNRVDLDPRSRHIEGTPVEPEAMLCVPLICADALLGVMSLYKIGHRNFSGTDLATINIFATQAAIALENATLFQRVAAERSRLSSMIHQMEEAVFFCDDRMEILVLNSAARGLVDRDDAVGKPLPDVAVAGMRQTLDGALGRLAGDTPRNVTEEFRIDDRVHLGSFTAIRDERNAVTGYIVLCKDITELKAMETQLLQSSKMSAVGQLASGLAHEFNNLIAAIYGYAQFMKNNREERVLAKGIDVILSSSERARDLTRSLLTFSRATDDGFEAVDLNEVMSDAILLVDQQVSKEGIRIVRESGRLPHAWVSRGRLIEVFMNLISNARHAMPEGGTLTLRTREDGDHLIVEVSDTGIGIPEADRERVFDPFFTTKGPLNGTRTPGTGLGLFTVYNVIQAHGGRVTLDSSRETGTTVRILLPVKRSPVAVVDPEAGRRAG